MRATAVADRWRDAQAADEVSITSTAGGIMPVRSMDQRPVGEDTPGPVTTRLKEMKWRLHADPAFSTPARCELAGAAQG